MPKISFGLFSLAICRPMLGFGIAPFRITPKARLLLAVVIRHLAGGCPSFGQAGRLFVASSVFNASRCDLDNGAIKKNSGCAVFLLDDEQIALGINQQVRQCTVFPIDLLHNPICQEFDV